MSREEFQKNQRVIFRWGGVQWFEGKIISVNGDGESYVIQEFEQFCDKIEGGTDAPLNTPGSSYTIPGGYGIIQPLPAEKSIMDRMADAYHKPPTFEDPFAHLYMETSGEIKLPPQHEISGLINQSDFIEMVKTVSNRRKIIEGSFGNIAMSPLKILHSILPKERDVWRLEQLAQEDPSAMLQLADIYRFGLLGLPKNRVRAMNLYMFAAVGWSEKDLEINGPFNWKFGYPMGSSEALTAVAQEMWLNLCEMYNVQREEDYDDLIRHLNFQHRSQVMDPMEMKLLEMIVPSLGHAIRRDWTSPFAVKFGKPMRVHQFLDPFLPDSMYIVNALECIEVRKNEQFNPVERKLVPTMEGISRPSDFQVECFMAKATKIFLDLPIKIATGPHGCPTDIHVEYREMPFPPYHIKVIVHNPHSNYVYETIRLPKELQYTPYSEDAFEFVWGNMVFHSMHRGDFRGGQRFRPKIITFADKPGDRTLALYVKKQIGGDACGTIIKLIDTRTYKVKFMGKTFTTQAAMEELDIKFAAMMKMREEKDFLSEYRTPIEMAISSFGNRSDMSVEELCSKIENLKQEGNEFFQRGRLQPAKRCYTDAIKLIQSNGQLNDNAFLLLGTLLSNRAACFLKIAGGMNLDSSKTALAHAFDDCETALTNKSCMRVLSSSIKAKLEKRKNIATKKLHRIISQSANLMRSEYYPETGVEGENAITNEQQTQLQPQRQQHYRRKKTKKGRKKQKQKQRRRERQQRKRQEGQEENSNSDESHEDEDDGHESVSIATGKEMLESKITPFVEGKEDSCPCCFDRFSIELEGVYCASNSCGHAYCLPCISGLMKRSQNGPDPLSFNCPVCRIPIDKDILTDSVGPIVSCTPSLKNRISLLPLKKAESKQVAKELCLRHDFKIPDILSALDVMLTDGLQASLRVSRDLSPSQKQEIYETARKPVDELWSEAKKLRSEMDLVYDLESENYVSMKERLDELQNTLIPTATKNAVDFIWQKMNSAGSMGIQDVNSGEIEVDFHALHVNEAIEVFNEQVLPILPAVVSVLLVVGRGNHSEGGNAKLKPALKRLIENHSKMRHSRVEGNDGVIRVRWIH